MRPRALALTLLTAVAAACAAPPPPAPAMPKSELEAQTEAAVTEVSSFLKTRVGLTPPQEEKTRAAARRLLERNAQLVEAARAGKQRILESLRQSHSRFDAEILGILMPDQVAKYFELKRSLQQQTALGRSPFAPSPYPAPRHGASPAITP